MTNYELWTDGSCFPNPGGPGGWAFRLIRRQPLQVDEVLLEGSGPLACSTTNQAELLAAINSLQQTMAQHPEIRRLFVCSDSAYVVNCFRDRWYRKWAERGWMNAANKPVENSDLWKVLLDLNQQPTVDVRWEHVRGHSGLEHNERVDHLAGQQRLQAQKMRDGDPRVIGEVFRSMHDATPIR